MFNRCSYGSALQFLQLVVYWDAQEAKKLKRVNNPWDGVTYSMSNVDTKSSITVKPGDV